MPDAAAMSWVQERLALFGIQWYATPDGWLDRSLGPAPEDVLRRCRSLGFAGVRIEVPPDLSVAEYADLLTRHDLAPAPGYLGLTINEDGHIAAEAFEQARRAAAVHAQLGVSGMFIGCGMDKHAARVARCPARGYGFDAGRLDRLIDEIGAVASLICAEGVRPGLHPHVGTWVETEFETRRVLDSLDPSLLAFGPDTGHLAWADIDPTRIMKDYRDRINHVHIKDISTSVARDSVATGRNYQETVLAGVWREPGLGDIDLDSVLDVLGPAFDGWLVVEVDRPYLPSADESIAACARWFGARI